MEIIERIVLECEAEHGFAFTIEGGENMCYNDSDWQDEPAAWNPESSFDPSDLSSDGIEEDMSLNEDYATFWTGE